MELILYKTTGHICYLWLQTSPPTQWASLYSKRSAGLILLLALLYSFIALVAICTLELERRYAAEDEEDIEDLWDDVRGDWWDHLWDYWSGVLLA